MEEQKWEYKILKSDLGYSIYRKKEEGKLMMLQYLNWDGKWVLSRDSARVFYSESDATSAFTVVKIKWNDIKETSEGTSECTQEKCTEKTSRSEF